MKAAVQPRWLMSFADLTLLLLAFFVMLHARAGEADGIVQSVGAALEPAPAQQQIRGYAAEGLFEPGEAVLRASARIELGALGKGWAHGGRVVVTSTGQSSPGFRFDRWELAAARTAAVARQVSLGGIPADRIDVAMVPAGGKAGQGQQIRLRHFPG